LAAVCRRDPDVVALQEVTPYTAELWRHALVTEGWCSFVLSFDLAPSSFSPSGPRRYGLALASRLSIVAHDPERFPVPWQERVLSAAVEVPHGCIEITTTHVPPGSSNGWIKIEHLEGLRAGVAAGSSTPRVLCGDFNTPRRELPTGEVFTFGQTESGRLNRARGARWDAAERGILLGLADLGMPDVFRALYGYQPQPASWILRRGHARFPRRFDHVFADLSLVPTAFTYVHELRESGLSDHSPAFVEFADRAGAARFSAGGKLRPCPAST
jgi:exonuclease III